MAARRVDELVRAYVPQLGKVPDQDIADKAGVSRSVIVNYRKRLGIAAYDGHRGTHAAPAPPPPPAPAPVKRGPGRPRKDAVTPVAPVVEAPKLDGRTRAARLAKADAPAPSAPKRPAPEPVVESTFRGRRSAIDPWQQYLGKLSDIEIANMAGVTPENVRTYRMRRGIAAPGKAEAAAPAKAAPVPKAVAAPVAPVKTAPPAPAKAAPAVAVKPAPAPPPAPAPAKVTPPAPAAKAAPEAAPAAARAAVTVAAVQSAFVVAVETAQGARSYALVASDIAEAARLAVSGVAGRHPDGAIKSIMKVAELL